MSTQEDIEVTDDIEMMSSEDQDLKHAPLNARTEHLRERAEVTPVSEVMSRSVVCLAPDARVDSVTEMFLERGISSAPVVDENWHPLGMISKTDLLRKMADDQQTSAGPHADGVCRIRDVTTPYILSLHEDASVSVAAAMMAYEGVHRLPIVASTGEVVGVISTLDIVRWLARCTNLDIPSETPPV